MSTKSGIRFLKILVLLGLFLVFFVGRNQIFAQESDGGDKRADLEKQLQQLEKEAEELDGNLKKTKKETTSLANEVKTLNSEIKIRELEAKRISLIIKKTDLEIRKKIENIAKMSQKINKQHKALSASLLLMYTQDQDSLLDILVKNRNLSDFFDSVNSLDKVQKNLQESLGVFKDEKTLLEKEKQELEEFEEEQRELKALQEVERKFLAQKQKEKEELLKLTKGKETLFQQLLKLKNKNITVLKTQLFYLEKTGITTEDAVRFADLAAQRAGIRTEFLLALLEVETGKQFEEGNITVGSNLGTGNWLADMSPSQRPAFKNITESLNLDPDKMPVSARPCSKATRERIGPGRPCGYGWGGAMGPAQFIPTTWLKFAEKVAEFTGHNPPNPWNVEDAFTASALFLAEAGANLKTEVGETRAAKIYLSGRASCSTYACRTYAKRILSLARDIGRIL